MMMMMMMLDNKNKEATTTTTTTTTASLSSLKKKKETMIMADDNDCNNNNNDDESFQDLMKIEGMVIDAKKKNELDITQSTFNSSCSSLQMGNSSHGSLGGWMLSPMASTSSPRKLSPRPHPPLKGKSLPTAKLSPKKTKPSLHVMDALDRAVASPKPPAVPKKNQGATSISPKKKLTSSSTTTTTKKVRNKLTSCPSKLSVTSSASAPSSGTTTPPTTIRPQPTRQNNNEFKASPSKSLSTPSSSGSAQKHPQPRMDLRAILKKHESQRKAPVYCNAMGDEVEFFGSMNSIPFLKSPHQTKKKDAVVKKKKKKKKQPCNAVDDSKNNALKQSQRPSCQKWIYGEFDDDDDDHEWTCYSSRTLNT